MKLRTISIAVAVAGFAGVAFAGSPSQLMQPLTVSGSIATECTPPNGSTGHACDAYDRMIRANFTPRQIGMLFGYRTSYPGYTAGGYDRLHQRYEALLQQYVAVQQKPTVKVASVATR